MKKICILMVTVLMISFSHPIVNAQVSVDTSGEPNSSSSISLYQLEEMVTTYITQLKENSNGRWGEATKISSSKALFGKDNEVTAYLFNLSTDNNSAGYIIVDTRSGQLIEYAFEGTCFLHDAIDETNEKANKKINNKSKESYSKKSGKVYWLGDINYVIEYKLKDNKNKRFYDITTDSCIEIDENDVEDYPCSSPDSQNSFITSPSSLESNYISSSVYTIPMGASINFFSMDQLVNHGCTAVAGTNLLFYYFNLDRGTYGNLLDVTWLKTYKDLIRDMKTKSNGGTSDSDAVAGYKKYLNSRGYNATVTLVKGSNNGIEIANELHDTKRPVHVSVYSHPTYGTHSVVAVGYQQYKYYGAFGYSYSTYIRIVDGWKPGTATRYIYGYCIGHWNYIKVSIKK